MKFLYHEDHDRVEDNGTTYVRRSGPLGVTWWIDNGFQVQSISRIEELDSLWTETISKNAKISEIVTSLGNIAQ